MGWLPHSGITNHSGLNLMYLKVISTEGDKSSYQGSIYQESTVNLINTVTRPQCHREIDYVVMK